MICVWSWPRLITCVVIVLALSFGAGVYSARADEPTQKQLDYQMLNQWRKEIVALQYTDFCNSVKKPSPGMMQVLQQVIAQGKEAKHPVADEIEQWFGSIMEQYAKKGCGDA